MMLIMLDFYLDFPYFIAYFLTWFNLCAITELNRHIAYIAYFESLN